MAEYIEREAAISFIKENQCKKCSYIGLCGGCAVLIAIKLFQTIPAADVQPVRHGRWFMRGGKWRCSECDQKALLRLSDATGGCREYEYYRANYCPNCGAKMEGIE